MRKDWLNAAVGFCGGSAAYYAFMLFCSLPGPRTVGFLPYQNAVGFWKFIVLRTEFQPGTQPYWLYFCALFGALLVYRLERPFREDVPVYSHRMAAMFWSFLSIVSVNLWFSLSVAPPRFLHL